MGVMEITTVCAIAAIVAAVACLLMKPGRQERVDAAESMPFGQFIQLLQQAGAYDAIYMDMGPGWNYSWYREYADSAATFIHSWAIGSATNWLVFHQK